MAKPKFDPRLLDDIARVAGGAVNIVSGLQQQIREDMRSRIDDFADRADLVPREDLDRAEAMIAKLRQRLDDLEGRVATLEGSKTKSAPAAKVTPNKASPKKTTTTKGKKTKK